MKNWLIGSVAAMALLGACGGSGGDQAAGAAGQDIKVGDVKVEGLKLNSGDAAKAGDALAAMSLSASNDGRVSFADQSTNGADASFSDVSIGIDDDVPLKAGALSFKGLDMTDQGASFSQMTLSDISISPPDEDGAVTLSSVQLTNPSPALAAWVGGLMGEGDPGAPPAFKDISFDGLTLSGFNFPAAEVDELDEASIGKIDLRQFSSSGIGAVVLDGFNLAGSDDGEAFNIQLGSMAMTGVTQSVMDIFAAGLEAGASGADSEELFEQISQLAINNPGDPGYDKFTLSNFVVDAAGLGIKMPGLDSIVERDGQDRATSVETKPFKISVSADPEGEVGAQLAGPLAIMGYETLNFSGEGLTKIDPDTDTHSYDSARNWIKLDDGFKLSWGLSASGLTEMYAGLTQAAENPDLLEAGLAKLSIQRLDINLEDNSIVEKAFATAGAMSGEDPASLKSQAIAGVAFLPLAAGQAGVDAGLAAELGGALSKFLSDSGTLSIKFDPSSPVTATDFEDPTVLTKDRLGFSATVK